MPPSEIDTAERIVRLETKLDFIIDKMHSLPPSPVCLAKHKEFDDKIDAMESWRNRAIGALLLVNILFLLFIDKIKDVFAGQ